MNVDSNVLDVFRQTTRSPALWNHPFLARCRTGDVSLDEVRVLASQMYRFSREFGRILAEIFVVCPDELARVVIAKNLFEELGEGEATRTHAELFRHFTRALGIGDAELESMPPEPETRALIETYLALPSRYGYVGALGAVCFASEGLVSTLYTQLQCGIRGAAALPREAMVFFEVHVVTDTGHAAELASVIEPHVGVPGTDECIRRAIEEAIDARVKFFDGVVRRANGVCRRSDAVAYSRASFGQRPSLSAA